MTEQVTGRALDALIAERVFGEPRTNPYPYSSTWEGLGRVVERMRELGWAWTMDYQLGSKFYTAEFWAHGKEPWGWAKADKAPDAVCRAALDALGEGES